MFIKSILQEDSQPFLFSTINLEIIRIFDEKQYITDILSQNKFTTFTTIHAETANFHVGSCNR